MDGLMKLNITEFIQKWVKSIVRNACFECYSLTEELITLSYYGRGPENYQDRKHLGIERDL
jgi:hypothetical protein